MSKKRGRKTQYRGVKALGDGRYRLRVYVSDPVTGRRKEAVRTVRAKSAKDANRLKELEQLRVMRILDGEPTTEGWSDSMPFGELADAWLEEVTTRTLDDDPTQLHLCPNTRERYEQSVRLMLKPFLGVRIRASSGEPVYCGPARRVGLRHRDRTSPSCQFCGGRTELSGLRPGAMAEGSPKSRIEMALGRPLTGAEQDVLQNRWEKFSNGFKQSLEAAEVQTAEAAVRVRRDSREAIEGVIELLEEAYAGVSESPARDQVFTAMMKLDAVLPGPRGSPGNSLMRVAVWMFDAFVEEKRLNRSIAANGDIIDVTAPNSLRVSDESLVRRLVVQCCEEATEKKSLVTEAALRQALYRRRGS